MHPKKLQKCRAMAAKALVQNGDRFFVEGAGDRIKALGGKREDADKDSWDTLSRELVEEAGLTEIKCVGGPFYRNGANYFHVTTTQTPVSRDVKVISHNLTELLSAENKDFTLKTALSLFVKQRNFPFDMRPRMDADRQELRDLEGNTLAFSKQDLDPAQLKRIGMILNTETEQGIVMHEERDPKIVKALLNSNLPFLDAPRKDPKKLTARQQLLVMRKQPRWIKVAYKRKTHGGRTYGRRYAETASYPPMQSMQKDLRAAFSGQMFDADQRVAYPTLVCELLGTKCPEPIINYVDNRKDVLKDCMDATGLTRDKVKPLYNIPLFADEQWILPYWETKHKTRIKEPYRTEFLAYMQACRKARSILLNAFPRFIEIATYTCHEKKTTNIRGSALSYLLGTVEDVVTEDGRMFFNRFPRYDPAVLIFDGLQVKVLKKMDESGIKQDIKKATAHIRAKYGWTRFKLAFKEIKPPCIPIQHSVPERSTDTAFASLYADTEGKRKLRITNSKGDGYLWNDDKRLWLKTESIYIRNSISGSLLERVNDEILSNQEILEACKNAKEGDKLFLKLTVAIFELEKLVKMRKLLEMSRTTKGILERVQTLCKDHDFEKTLDRLPHELPLRGGVVIDLKTLKVRRREISDLWSFELDVSYIPGDADPDGRWLKFFTEICNVQPGESSAIVTYVQEALAYCLTGETFERKIYLMYGSGRNGKSTLIDLMKKVLGPFYTAISEQVFMSQKRRSGSATPELIVLQRARLGVFSEGKQDDSLDANRLKMLTGNDDISARPLFGPQFTFRPQTKYVLLTNHLPDFNVDDTAMVDRIALIPFQHVFELKPENTAFVSSLAEAIDGLFTILARKANEVYARGSVTKPPAEAVDAFESYTSGLDTIQQFIDSACDTGHGLQCERTELFEAYSLYSEQEGCKHDPKKMFYSKMVKRGYIIKRKNTGQRFFKNIALK